MLDFFEDGLIIYELLRMAEIEHHAKELLNSFDADIDSGRIELYTDCNRLSKWDSFFPSFAMNQYILYGMIHEKEEIRRLYEACYKDNLHSIWANRELYRKGNSEAEFFGMLEKNMRPVWD